jgi:hypothetical protein
MDRNRAAVFPSCGMTPLPSALFSVKGSNSSSPAATIM